MIWSGRRDIKSHTLYSIIIILYFEGVLVLMCVCCEGRSGEWIAVSKKELKQSQQDPYEVHC
jgi:hypothetical protein